MKSHTAGPLRQPFSITIKASLGNTLIEKALEKNIEQSFECLLQRNIQALIFTWKQWITIIKRHSQQTSAC